MRDVVIAFLLGVVMGAGAVLTYLFSQGEGQVSRTVAQVQVVNSIKKAFKSSGPDFKVGRKGLFLDFETEKDVKFFQLTDGLYAEVSSERASSGKRSLFLEFPKGASYPGLYWEVFESDKVIDISGCDYFGFDVYANSQFDIRLEVKLKSGKNYPKKVFERTVVARARQWTKVRIPISELRASINPAEISYIKVFIPSPATTYELFLDGFGCYKGSTTAGLFGPSVAWAGEVPLGFKVGLVESVYKVIPKRSYLRDRLKVKPSLELYLAKGEDESFQLVFYDVKREKRVRIVLEGDEENFTVKTYQVKFVRTKRPYYSVIHVGEWPDPMVPIQFGKEIELEPGKVSLFWITLSTKDDAKPGDYRIAVKVSSDEGDVSLPVSVRVWRFSIPRKSSLRTAFDVYDQFFGRFFPRKKGEDYRFWKERIKRIKYSLYQLMLDYRMSPMLKAVPTDVGFEEMIRPLLEKGLNAFAIGRYGGSFGNNWPKDEKKLKELIPVYRDYAHKLRKMGLLDMVYIYTWDEGEIGNPVVEKVAEMIHRADPGLKNLVCYHGLWDPSSLPGWGRDIDIWCFQIRYYDKRLVRKLQSIPMEVWMYVSGPDGRTPNLVIDSMGVEHRIIPWMIFGENLDGFLYWAVNFWQGGDPWENTFNTPWKQNGNGMLFYPLNDGIVPSIRAEIFRDGMEDYEYFVLVKKVMACKELSAAQHQLAKRLLDFSLFYQSFGRYTHDGGQLLERRREIGEFLDGVVEKCGR